MRCGSWPFLFIGAALVGFWRVAGYGKACFGRTI
jgi:hypothetical protein